MKINRFSIIFAFLALLLNNVSGQLPPFVECMDEGDAFVGLDRKGWTSDINRISESYQLNFQIPQNSPYECALIDRVVFTVNGFSGDLSNSRGCIDLNFTHVLDCHSNDL